MKINKITAAQRVELARHAERPTASEYINEIFDNFIELSGDRCYGEDASIIGGIAFYRGQPVTVLGHQKGRNLEDNMKYRFGMPNPEGYRKAVRLMKQAEKFDRPLITFIDTPGAYPGMEAEERGQGQAISECIMTMGNLHVPSIAIFVGEGGSGGALALAVADKMIMLENSIFSILSPEGFASILWKDSSRWKEACDAIKMTSEDLKALGICDVIIPETSKGAHGAREYIYDAVDKEIYKALVQLMNMSEKEIVKNRYKRLRNVGKFDGRH